MNHPLASEHDNTIWVRIWFPILMEEHRSRVAEEQVVGVSEKTGKEGAHSTNGEMSNVYTSSVGEDAGKEPFG